MIMRFAYAVVVLTAVLALPGCGQESRIEKLDLEREELLEKMSEDADRDEPLFRAADRGYRTAFELRHRAKTAYALGNPRAGRELDAEARAAGSRAKRLERLMDIPAGLRMERRLVAIEAKLMTLDGCDRRCQAREERDKWKELRCQERLMRKTGIGPNRADEICGKRFFKDELLGP